MLETAKYRRNGLNRVGKRAKVNRQKKPKGVKMEESIVGLRLNVTSK